MLTRCMLHAFYGEWGANEAVFDHFDCGIVHAAWLAIQNAVSGPDEEPYFNDLWHDEQLPEVAEYQRPEYTYLSVYNRPEMATRMSGFFLTEVDSKIAWARYRTCGYLWWKVFRQDNNFFKEFNAELAKMHSEGFPAQDQAYRELHAAAERSYAGGPIENVPFVPWFTGQPIFNDTPWASLYRTKSRPFDPPATGKVAVKVINHYGDEVLKVFEVGEG